MITAIVPAAGLSTRMGKQNKLLLTFRGKTLIENAVDTLLSSEVDEVIVVLGYEAGLVREKLGDKKVKLIENPDYSAGMSTSIRAGLAVVSPEADAIIIYLADQPLLEPRDVNRLVREFAAARSENKSIAVPFFHGQRGNPAILDACYKANILSIVGDVGCKRIIRNNPDQVRIVEMETDHVVRDLDTIEDYNALLQEKGE